MRVIETKGIVSVADMERATRFKLASITDPEDNEISLSEAPR